ncbi:MAG: hypothetical protein RDU47_06060 [Spirochaetia bacterium]|jgi:hypothetical protein|nr:hypothetical protein [Spirochaetia bacterium]
MYIIFTGGNPFFEAPERILFLALTGGKNDPTIQSSKPFDCPSKERV